MNTKTTLAILAVLTAFALVAATTTSVIVPADAQGGPKGEKNFGQCKQDLCQISLFGYQDAERLE